MEKQHRIALQKQNKRYFRRGTVIYAVRVHESRSTITRHWRFYIRDRAVLRDVTEAICAYTGYTYSTRYYRGYAIMRDRNALGLPFRFLYLLCLGVHGNPISATDPHDFYTIVEL